MKVPWVTPLTIDRNMDLPPLEALHRKAHRVGRTFVDELGHHVVQYIRAHPRLKGDLEPSSILMQLEQTATPVPIPVRQEGDDLITDEVCHWPRRPHLSSPRLFAQHNPFRRNTPCACCALARSWACAHFRSRSASTTAKTCTYASAHCKQPSTKELSLQRASAMLQFRHASKMKKRRELLFLPACA